MAKKFKLSKEYPGSPKLGTIVEINEHDFLAFIPNDDKFYGIYPEKFPEFWEEVIELCIPIGTKFKYYEDDITIYTVENVNSDKVTISWKEGNRPVSMTYSITTVNEYFKEGYWKEYKEPLFTTEDGVEINDPEQEVYWLEVDKYITHGKKAINMKNKIDNLYFKNHIKVFSTEKAAQNYIKIHKPVLSYNDVLKLYDRSSYSFQREEFKKELTELVKSKL